MSTIARRRGESFPRYMDGRASRHGDQHGHSNKYCLTPAQRKVLGLRDLVEPVLPNKRLADPEKDGPRYRVQIAGRIEEYRRQMRVQGLAMTRDDDRA